MWPIYYAIIYICYAGVTDEICLVVSSLLDIIIFRICFYIKFLVLFVVS